MQKLFSIRMLMILGLAVSVAQPVMGMEEGEPKGEIEQGADDGDKQATYQQVILGLQQEVKRLEQAKEGLGNELSGEIKRRESAEETINGDGTEQNHGLQAQLKNAQAALDQAQSWRGMYLNKDNLKPWAAPAALITGWAYITQIAPRVGAVADGMKDGTVKTLFSMFSLKREAWDKTASGTWKMASDFFAKKVSKKDAAKTKRRKK